MTGADIRVIIGASSQAYPGWIRTQQAELDLTRHQDWARRFDPGSISRVLAEHVWEHLSPDDASVAARICFEFLKPGGFVRCAVPDGLFASAEYQSLVQIGGPGSLDHPAATHKVVYTWPTLTRVFEVEGFYVKLLEWWDEDREFHASPWDESDGFVYRSARFDHRNQEGALGFTSLIVDAIKPG
ncbi:hypothetical protein BH24CHL3_BH24CHL3_04970 [soil metagenome]